MTYKRRECEGGGSDMAVSKGSCCRPSCSTRLTCWPTLFFASLNSRELHSRGGGVELSHAAHHRDIILLIVRPRASGIEGMCWPSQSGRPVNCIFWAIIPCPAMVHGGCGSGLMVRVFDLKQRRRWYWPKEKKNADLMSGWFNHHSNYHYQPAILN